MKHVYEDQLNNYCQFANSGQRKNKDLHEKLQMQLKRKYF